MMEEFVGSERVRERGRARRRGAADHAGVERHLPRLAPHPGERLRPGARLLRAPAARLEGLGRGRGDGPAGAERLRRSSARQRSPTPMPARATGSRLRATWAAATSSTAPFSPSARPTRSRTSATSPRSQRGGRDGPRAAPTASSDATSRRRSSIAATTSPAASTGPSSSRRSSRRRTGRRDLALARDRRGDGDRVLARARLRPRAGLAPRQQRRVLAREPASDRARPSGRSCRPRSSPRSRSSPVGIGLISARAAYWIAIGYGVAALIWWGLLLRAQGADVRARDDRRRARQRVVRALHRPAEGVRQPLATARGRYIPGVPFGLGIWEILILAGVLVLLFGAKGAPAMARRLGIGVQGDEGRRRRDGSPLDPRSEGQARRGASARARGTKAVPVAAAPAAAAPVAPAAPAPAEPAAAEPATPEGERPRADGRRQLPHARAVHDEGRLDDPRVPPLTGAVARRGDARARAVDDAALPRAQRGDLPADRRRRARWRSTARRARSGRATRS